MKPFACLLLMSAVTFAVCAEEPQPLTLARKAAVFDHDMQTRFVLDGQALCKRKAPTIMRNYPAYNMPDNAYMTGMYLGTLAMQYAATKDEAVRERASASLRALDLLCTVTGEKGLLARAAWPTDKPYEDDGEWNLSEDKKYRWRGDVSSDQMTGVFFGFALAYDLVANDEEKALIATRAAELAGHLLDNNMHIIDIDGQRTTWGRYDPDYCRWEKLNAVLLLQHLKVAYHVTGDERFGEAYRHWAIDAKYAEAAQKARRAGNPTRRGAVNHSDDVLLFLGYFPLLEYEQDPALRQQYAAGLRHAWEGTETFPGVKPEANPFHAFMVDRFLKDASGNAAAIETLRRFPFTMKWRAETIKDYAKQFNFSTEEQPKSPEAPAGAPVPIDRRGKSWSAWVQDPYSPDRTYTEHEPIEYNGHDYLIGYWLGRYTGVIEAD